MGKSAAGEDTVLELEAEAELRRWFPIPPVPSGRERQTEWNIFSLRQKNWNSLKIPERSWSFSI